MLLIFSYFSTPNCVLASLSLSLPVYPSNSHSVSMNNTNRLNCIWLMFCLFITNINVYTQTVPDLMWELEEESERERVSLRNKMINPFSILGIGYIQSSEYWWENAPKNKRKLLLIILICRFRCCFVLFYFIVEWHDIRVSASNVKDR